MQMAMRITHRHSETVEFDPGGLAWFKFQVLRFKSPASPHSKSNSAPSDRAIEQFKNCMDAQAPVTQGLLHSDHRLKSPHDNSSVSDG
jgi:hypothetical protein